MRFTSACVSLSLLSLASLTAVAGAAPSDGFDRMECSAAEIHVVEVLSVEGETGMPLGKAVDAVAQVKCLRTLKGEERQGKTISIAYAAGLRNTPHPEWSTGSVGIVFVKYKNSGNYEFSDEHFTGFQPANAAAPSVAADAPVRVKIEREFLAVVASANEQRAMKALGMLLAMDSATLRAEAATVQKVVTGFLAAAVKRAVLTLRVRDGDVNALREIKTLSAAENDPFGHVNSFTSRLKTAVQHFNGKDGTAALCDLLDHEEGTMRHSAAYALRYVGDESAVPALVSHLSDENDEFRVSYNCMAALFRLSGNNHLPSTASYDAKRKAYNDGLREWAKGRTAKH